VLKKEKRKKNNIQDKEDNT